METFADFNADAFGAGALSPRFDAALAFASELHRKQRRKNGNVPYLSHLLRVAGLTLDYGASEDVAIAALLHDAVEDCGGMRTAETIRRLFGDSVADVVLETSDSTTAGPVKAPWRERKERYLARLETGSLDGALVSGCDKLDNATSLARALEAGRIDVARQFKGGVDGTVWYYRSVVDVLRTKNVAVASELEIATNRLVFFLKKETGFNDFEKFL